jgi:hypothetical protein
VGRKRGIQYRAGSHWMADDRSGFTRRRESIRREWTGLEVAENLWEARQPQDFVRGVPDDQTVDVSRPQPPAVFSGPISIGLSRPAAIGDTFLYLDAINGFSNGDNVGVMLDSGQIFNTTVNGAPATNGVTISAPMPNVAAQGNLVTDYEAPGP